MYESLSKVSVIEKFPCLRTDGTIATKQQKNRGFFSRLYVYLKSIKKV